MTGCEAVVLVVICVAGRRKLALSGLFKRFNCDLDGVAAGVAVI